jgi:predicted transcriptional regulator
MPRASTKSPLDLGRRERQIMEIVYRLGEATVGDVLAELPEAVSYSTVRTMLGKLERKGLLRHAEDGPRYVYRATMPLREARRSVLARVVHNFFAGSPAQTVSTLLDLGRGEITPEELDELAAHIARLREGEG